MQNRRFFISTLLIALGLTGCASLQTASSVDPAIKTTLAPTGVLRIAGYKGSPTSLVVVSSNASGTQYKGITHDLGQLLAKRLGVPVQVIEYERIAQVLDALKTGKADMTFTNASPARQAEFAFTKPLISQELGYLVPAGGKLQSVEAVDQAGITIGVSLGSSSQSTLSASYKAAKIKTYPHLELAKNGLLKAEIDGFATNKGNLNEMMSDLNQSVPFKILPGRWGMEHFGVGIPKERAAAIPFVQSFADELKKSGQLAKIAVHAGLTGVEIAP